MIGKIAWRTLIFLSLAAVLCFVHDWIFSTAFQNPTHYTVLQDYGFIALACLFVIAASLVTYWIQKKYTTHAYLGASLLKMLAAMYFIVQIRVEVSTTLPDFFNFTLAYFPLLVAELWVVLGLLKKPINSGLHKDRI